MTRVFSGMQPSGDVHLGNYLGALRHWVTEQYENDAFYCVVDLHAMTVPQDPVELRARTLELATLYLAIGLDPEVCTLFVQSHVREHTELTWLLECTAAFGELRRMTQFKDKTAKGGEETARVALFAYPVLMAADILLYDTERVPVGDDQRQHLELTRDLAQRFNHRYGDTFVVPEAAVAAVAGRVMDLQDPTRKMSKSSESPQGTVLLLDDPALIERKIKRAVTDSEAVVRFDWEKKPGLANVIELLAVASGRTPEEVAASYRQYGPLKADCAAAVIEMVLPIQERYRALRADPDAVTKTLQRGAEKAREVAARTLERARDNMGLLPG